MAVQVAARSDVRQWVLPLELRLNRIEGMAPRGMPGAVDHAKPEVFGALCLSPKIPHCRRWVFPEAEMSAEDLNVSPAC